MKIVKLLLLTLIFAFGILIGSLISDFPILRLNTEVRVFEPLTFLLTATIGVLIPFYIKRWIDDSRQIKNNLIDEVKATLNEYAIIKERIISCHHKKVISSGDKEEITGFFEQADLKLTCLTEQLIAAYNKETKIIRNEIHSSCIEYWKFTTSAEMMSSSFVTITDSFFRQHNEIFLKFETVIKRAIILIHKL